MAYHLERHENIQAAMRRIASEQVRAGMAEIDDATLDRHDVVHQLRRRCKKLRGLLRLFRPVLPDGLFAAENVCYRDLARELSGVRDSQASLEAFDELLRAEQPAVDARQLTWLREHLADRRQSIVGEDRDLSQRLLPVRQALECSARRIESWTVQGDGFEALSPGLVQVYRGARRAMRQAAQEATSEHFHQWRKRVKYHWHHAHLLRKISPPLMKAHRRMAEQLGELLGQDHDLVLLRQQITAAPDPGGTPSPQEQALSLIARRQTELQMQTVHLGQQLFAETPRSLAKRWHGYWQSWQTQVNSEPEVR